MHPPGRPDSTPHRWITVCCLTAGTLYTLWLLGPWTNPQLTALHGYASELAARDQPASILFRTGDALTGLLATTAALLGLHHPPPNTRRDTWTGLLLFGLATLTNATLTPLDCAVLTDSACAHRENLGAVSTAHTWHATTSSLAITGALIAILTHARTARHSTLAWTWAVLILLTTAATLTGIATGTLIGLSQRLQLATLAAWLITFTHTGPRRHP